MACAFGLAAIRSICCYIKCYFKSDTRNTTTEKRKKTTERGSVRKANATLDAFRKHYSQWKLCTSKPHKPLVGCETMTKSLQWLHTTNSGCVNHFLTSSFNVSWPLITGEYSNGRAFGSPFPIAEENKRAVFAQSIWHWAHNEQAYFRRPYHSQYSETC